MRNSRKKSRKKSRAQQSGKSIERRHRTWVEVDYRAIERNARGLKKLLAEGAAMMAVVKSNAYGHGMVASALAALRGGATWLAVDEIAEALELREAGIKAPILVLGYTLPPLYETAAKKRISITVSSLEALQRLAAMRLPKAGKAGKNDAKKRGDKGALRIHLKFDTGLHRQGISESHVQQAARIVSADDFPAVVEGAFTHFAVMEDPMKQEYSKKQSRLFKEAVDKLLAKGVAPITHAGATSAILFSKDFHFDMTRAGIGLYGLWPSPEMRRWAGDSVVLEPALSWKTILTEIKLVSKGARVGYDLTHEMGRDSRIAVVPVGYWHGLPRTRLSGTNGRPGGHMLIRGKRAPIVGRISMDMTIVDVTDIPSARPGDEVVIIGTQDKESIRAEEVAEKDGTINYEIVTRINPFVPRVSA
ncbi:MAG: alanine racemase [Patescibacteria group bacterium]|nr:alanine racemase [Patescibacteria group bacterium]MDE2116429.1 alanine racemase [Patescibacteria group bacterium]